MIRCVAILCLTWTSICLVDSQAFGQRTRAPERLPALPGIDAAMQKFVDDGQISGAVTVVAHDGKIVHLGATGMANIEFNQAMKPWTLFSIASMTKPIVASAVMILQDDGKLSVDGKVSTYLPAFATMKLQTGDDADREITIRDALTHTSGMAGDQVLYGSLAAAVDHLAQRPLAFQPETNGNTAPG